MMDAKQAVELLRKDVAACKVWSVKGEIADLIESLAAKAELGKTAIDEIKKCSVPKDLKLNSGYCNRCVVNKTCRLQAGREQG